MEMANVGIISEKEIFTCSTCSIACKDLRTHREHYGSQWHRYNLHRKIAELPPITLEEFEKKNTIYSTGHTSQTKQKWNCTSCRKNFNSEQQYKNHLDSKSHKKKIKKVDKDNEVINSQRNSENITEQTEMETDSDVESVDSDDWLVDFENPVKYNSCLFCDQHSRTTMRNLKHMMRKHSFFIPDLDHCIDRKGLLMYIGEKIYGEYMCIWCNDSGRQLQSAEAARMHMIDKGHCKLLFEGEAMLEYLRFYDYSSITTSSHPDAEGFDTGEKSLILPMSDVLLDDGYNLHLPSGKVVGHRSLALYYKQNLNPTVAITKAKDSSQKLHKLIQQYRALGGPEMQVEASRRRARDIQYIQRAKAKYSTKLQFKQNKLQKYYRPQTLF